MDIVDHLLTEATFEELSHGPLARPPRYIVLHNTAGGSVAGSIEHLRKKGFSYHVLVSRTGELVQCVPFHRAAGHAGRSNWRGQDSLNGFSIGISAANYGPLSPQADGKFYNRGENGKVITGVFTADEVVVQRHRNGGGKPGWEKYREPQISAMLRVCEALVAEYKSIVDIVGHDDIAVGRKVDPGPAFPMHRFHALVPGRKADPGPRMRVDTPGDTLSLRDAPVAEANKIGELEHGRIIHLRARAYTYISATKTAESGWASIDMDGDLDHDGFVSGKYLVPEG